MWQNFLDSQWFNFLFPLLLLICIAGGVFHATKYKRRKNWEASGIENSILAIFGLIISFTFLMAGNAHRERYGYVHQEANSIEKLFRYSKEMPDSFARYTQSSLINFLDNQLAYYHASASDSRLFLKNATTVSDDYWAYLSAFKIKNNNPVLQNPLDKIAGCFDDARAAFSMQVYSHYERTPGLIMFLLLVISLLIGYLVGFMNGIKASIHYLVPVIYFVMITLVMMVIRDLNNPLQGFIRPDYHDLNNIYGLIKGSR